MLERPESGLAAWGNVLRRDRLRRRLIIRSAWVLGGSAVLLATSIVRPTPLLVWNASPSMPIGLYRVVPLAQTRIGYVVIARPPRAVRMLAAERRYLPLGVPLVKKIAAVAGDRVCWHGSELRIAGRLTVHRLPADRNGRPLPWREGCQRLASGAVLLLAPQAPDSFDGRYFGPSAASDILGKAVPLWLC